MARPLWTPTATDLVIHKLLYFAQVKTYPELLDWTIKNPDRFWSFVWQDSKVIGEMGDITISGEGFFGTKFFPNAKLNIINTLLQGDDDQIIITAITEAGIRRKLTRCEVRRAVNQVANALTAIGVKPGDVVAAWVPNVAEVVVYTLGALSIGAVVSTASPDFGTTGVLDRFGQIEPKVLLAAPNYQYNGKDNDCLDRLPEIVAGLPTLKQVLLIGAQNDYADNFESWYSKKSDKFQPLNLPFDQPGFILFSSGTTGKPKCIVHSAAGVMLKVLSETRYNLDIRPTDNIFYYTTCGWMMWNWLFMVLATGASIVLYDGNPVFPRPARLFDMAQEEKITLFGVSAKYLDSLKKFELKPKETHNLSFLKTITSTGSPLSPEGFDYVYESIKSDVHLASISGGTDICGCFVMGNPIQPVYSGEIQGPALGMNMSVFNESGKPAKVDEKGELVCLQPFPSKPLYFGNDDGDKKYKAAYFEKFDGIWAHGDFAAITKHGGYVIYGRSDATLNSGGVRIGTAEIYRIVEEFVPIQEAMAVAQEWENDTRVILFVKMRDGYELTDSLVSDIKYQLRAKASPRHVPAKIIVAPELPRTKSNKLVELAVTEVINNREVKNLEALANPESLAWFKNLSELQG
ncbi:MAG: acetoacetate--CoA ligase [Actinobacteria bacterium]|nr:acetoacetate--CoA ligase [Actinomycetota bacterium]